MLHHPQDPRALAAESDGVQSAKPAKEPVYAALDLGTNNCRLLVASTQSAEGGAPASLRVHDSFSRIVRLGEGVGADGRLSDDAMERTLSALKACQKKLQKYALTRARFVATEACRRASNSREFLSRVQEETGLSIDIISSEEEAKLAFLGCSSLLRDVSDRAVVFDIGGGSTELMWIDSHQAKHSAHSGNPLDSVGIHDWLSIGFGVMNLADKFGGADFAEMAFEDMAQCLQDRLAPFETANRIGERIEANRMGVQLLSTSGTVTTLAAIHLDLPRYDRARIDGITLKISEIRATIEKLLAMRPSERFNHPCIGPDRADFIISGCAIFEAISRTWPVEDITIADRGVREGIILSLAHEV